MDPEHIEQSNLSLPIPSSGVEAPKSTPEKQIPPEVPETSAVTGSLAPASSLPNLTEPTGDTSPLPPATPVNPAPSMPALASDDDLIEKEWVEKAKAIISRTKSDPYSENRELNHLKADYMKKRYNRDIKVAEDQV